MKRIVRILPTGRKEVTTRRVLKAEAPKNGFSRGIISLPSQEVVIDGRRFTGREEKSSRKFSDGQ